MTKKEFIKMLKTDKLIGTGDKGRDAENFGQTLDTFHRVGLVTNKQYNTWTLETK